MADVKRFTRVQPDKDKVTTRQFVDAQIRMEQSIESTAKAIAELSETRITAEESLSTIGDVTGEPTGFSSRADSTIAFSGTTREFTISPVSSSFDVYVNGVLFSYSVTQIVQISDTTGTHFIYFDSEGVLRSSTTLWSYTDAIAFVATIYWRAGGSTGILMEERHGLTMDRSTHEYLHNTVSTRYGSGLGGTFNATNTFTVTSGTLYDEDLKHTIATQTNCRIMYRDGAGAWNFSSPGAALYTETAGVIQYDDGDGTTADVPAANYVAYWVFATNDTSSPIWSIIGQRVDSTIANARANNLLSLLVLTGLPAQEIKLLYRVIIRRNGTSEVIEEATDYRNISSLPVGSYVATDHTSLSNLNSSGYYHLTQTNHDDLTDGGSTTLHKHDHDNLDSLLGPHVFIGGVVFDTLASGSVSTYYDGTGLGKTGTTRQGYAICNGNNGTPNLGALFVRMSTSGAGGTGGSDTHTLSTSEIPSHSHSIDHDHGSFNSGTESNALYGYAGPNATNGPGPWSLGSGTHVHAIDVPAYTGTSGSAGTGGSHNNMPAYYELIPVMRVS